MCYVPPAHTHQPFDFTRIHKHGLEGQHSVPRDVSFLSWSSGVSGRRRLLGCIGVLHYLLRHALGAPHPCVFLKRGSGHQGLGTRVWLQLARCLGFPSGCILPTGCPTKEPTRHGCTTWGCAPRCCSQRPFVSRCILSIGRPAKQSARHVPLGFATLSFIMDRGTLFPADTLSDSKAFTGQRNALSVWDMKL